MSLLLPVPEGLAAQCENKALRSIDRVCRYLLGHPRTTALDWLADRACLSEWQFYRQFKEQQGISLKLYARIARFENVRRPEEHPPHCKQSGSTKQLHC